MVDLSLDVDHSNVPQACPHMLFGFFVVGRNDILYIPPCSRLPFCLTQPVQVCLNFHHLVFCLVNHDLDVIMMQSDRLLAIGQLVHYCKTYLGIFHR